MYLGLAPLKAIGKYYLAGSFELVIPVEIRWSQRRREHIRHLAEKTDKSEEDRDH
jgi:hypothetical protein